MDWKKKIKWKILIILAAILGIFVVWCAGKAGEMQSCAESEILKEYAVKENEWASAKEEFQIYRDSKSEVSKPTDTEAEPMDKKVETAGPSIRVLLMTNGFEGYYHNAVSIKFQGDYKGKEAPDRIYKDGEILELHADSPELEGGCFTLLPQGKDNKVTLLSLNRGQGNPSYRGSMEIHRSKEGIKIINELPLEEYLYAVVPSEMPASYPEEALKAQAVCARTYACVQMQGSKLTDLGAQVDDSVSFQVYQNSQEAESASAAVRDTEGQILLNNKKPINAYYFSTSHGKTSTDEVWETSVPSGYLQSVECTYDSEEPWYEWSVAVSMRQILENVQSMFPDTTSVTGAEIREKGEGEAVMNLTLFTNQGEKSLHSEYDIRSVLAPKGSPIVRKDGSQVKGGNLLPSAYFVLEEQRDEKNTLTGYNIHGGGYGHGVGMSQNGAKGMANEGKDYKEILSYFYKNVEIGNINDVVNSGDS